jgi:hypothetical protein
MKGADPRISETDPGLRDQAAGGSIATPYLMAMATSDHLARCFGMPPNRDAGL